MNGRLTPVLAFATAALLLAPTLPSAATHVAAQDAQGRFRVLVPPLFPDEGTDDDFGKDTAKKLRELLDALPTHTALEEGEIKDQLERLADLKVDDVVKGKGTMDPCLTFRQLGSQMNTEVAFCAWYRETGDDMVDVYKIQFWQLQSQQSFDVEPFTISKDDDEEAAERIMASFDTYVEQANLRTYCYDYAQSKDWENALRNCDQALEMNPNDISVLEQRAIVYQNQGEYDKALQDLKKVLAQDELRESALQRAGYVATMLGRDEEGREYYSQYLELNPSDVAVRRKIAYDAYDAGDPEGAMLLLEEGLEHAGDNPGLLTDYAGYAMNAAAEKAADQPQADSGDLTPEVADLYRKAVDAYMKVYEIQPDSMSVDALRNVVAANIQLDELDRALELGEQFTSTHPDEAPLWAIYADALRRSDRLDDALEAMKEVERLNPDYPDLYARQGSWLLDADRVEDAVPYLQKAVERGKDPNTMARLILGRAHSNGVRQENYQYAIDLLRLAKSSFDVGPEQLKELNFWLGFSLYTWGSKLQEAKTVEMARRTLPMFEEAKRLFQSAVGYGQVGDQINQYIANTDTYIEIQNAVIKRGGG